MDTNMAHALCGMWTHLCRLCGLFEFTSPSVSAQHRASHDGFVQQRQIPSVVFCKPWYRFNHLFVCTLEQQDHAVPERSADGLQPDRVPLADCVRHASQRWPCGAQEESHSENRLWEQVRFGFLYFNHVVHQTDIWITFIWGPWMSEFVIYWYHEA